MKKTATRLADGRELIYYDERDDAVRRLDDNRDLPKVTVGSELRFDPLQDEWVIVASHRQSRTYHPPSDQCPLCPSRSEHETEIPSSDYDVVVFENRFPSMAMTVDEVDQTAPGQTALTEVRPGRGRCEVVCFTSDHERSFSQLSPDRVATVLEVWIDRTLELSAIPGIEQVFPFENCGEEIGVTLSHPHGQIYGYPFVTPRTANMLQTARRYEQRTSRNLFADVLSAERQQGTRVIAENNCWTAVVPAAARWPVEVHLYPRRQLPDLPALNDAERATFPSIYLNILQRLDRLYGKRLPYVAAWYQAPVNTDRDLAYLHLQVFSIRRAPDKLKYLAGSESAMGVWINDTAPEILANRLREAVG